MKTPPLAAVIAACAVAVTGCTHWNVSKRRPAVTTELTADREARMRTMVEDLKSKGYSDDRAKQIAAKEVPLVQTTYTESFFGIFAGDAKQKKFDENLARSESARRP